METMKGLDVNQRNSDLEQPHKTFLKKFSLFFGVPVAIVFLGFLFFFGINVRWSTLNMHEQPKVTTALIEYGIDEQLKKAGILWIQRKDSPYEWDNVKIKFETNDGLSHDLVFYSSYRSGFWINYDIEIDVNNNIRYLGFEPSAEMTKKAFVGRIQTDVRQVVEWIQDKRAKTEAARKSWEIKTTENN